MEYFLFKIFIFRQHATEQTFLYVKTGWQIQKTVGHLRSFLVESSTVDAGSAVSILHVSEAIPLFTCLEASDCFFALSFF